MDDKIHVYLVDFLGKPREFHVLLTDTVHSLLSLAGLSTNSRNIYHFFYKGHSICPYMTFKANNIEDYDNIQYIVKKRINFQSLLLKQSYEVFHFENFVFDIFDSFLQASDLYYTTVEADRDAQIFYQKILKRENEIQEKKSLFEVPNRFPTVIESSTHVQTDPLPTLWFDSFPTAQEAKTITTKCRKKRDMKTTPTGIHFTLPDDF